MDEAGVCLQMFLSWLSESRGQRLNVDEREEISPGGLSALASDGTFRLALEVRSLLGATEDYVWLSHRDQLAQEMSVANPGTLALWLPLGADLPREAAEAADLLERVRQTAVSLEAGERSFVPLPITLVLRKASDEGGIVEVKGGLNPYWAQFTDQVRGLGTFVLDSTRLHRLPESEEHREQLLDTIRERLKELESVRQSVEIETIDTWTIQRFDGADGLAIMGLPPREVPDVGLAVRRNFRRILAEAGPRLRQREADLRAIVVLGHYPRLEQEGATTALRGYDPALYAGLDFVGLAADGILKPLIQPLA